MRSPVSTPVLKALLIPLALAVVLVGAAPSEAKKRNDKKKRDRSTSAATENSSSGDSASGLASPSRAVEKAEQHLLAYQTDAARQALDGAPNDDGWSVAARGWVFQQQADYDRASAEYRKAAELDPSNPVPLLRLGESLTYAEKPGASEAYAEAEKRARSLVDSGRSAETLLLLGVAQQRQKRFSEAATTFQAARELTSGDPMIAFHLGATHFYLQNWRQAFDELTAAIDGNPEIALAYYYRGLAAGKLEKKDVLFNDLDRFVRMAPKAPEADYARRLLAAFG